MVIRKANKRCNNRTVFARVPDLFFLEGLASHKFTENKEQ